MASRNLTAKFIAEREHWRSFGASFDAGPQPDEDQDSLLAGQNNAHGAGGAPPIWVDIVDEIESNLLEIDKGMTALEELHNRRLKISFTDDEEEQDKIIDAKAQSITSVNNRSYGESCFLFSVVFPKIGSEA